MRALVMGIIAIICYAIQTTLLDFVQIYGIKPNLILIITISYALIRGKDEGAFFGAFAGLIMDIMGGRTFGIYTLMGLYLGFSIGALRRNLYEENYLIPMMLTGIGTFIYNFIIHFFVNIFTGQGKLIWYVLVYNIPETIYNSIISVFIYFFILIISRKFERTRKVPKLY